MNRLSWIGSAALLAGVLTACSSGSAPANSPASTHESSSGTPASSMHSSGASMPANAPMITIKSFMFAVTGKIHPGEKIMVTNQDGEAHTVTADSGNAFNVAVPASSTVTLTAPMKAGTYKFHCNIHSNMHGVLTVG